MISLEGTSHGITLSESMDLDISPSKKILKHSEDTDLIKMHMEGWQKGVRSYVMKMSF